MLEKITIGTQNFEKIRTGNTFYIDKTNFIKEWWDKGDDVTLITRPRRFGKTLNMSMIEYFFSVQYEGRGDLFEGLSVWNEGKYRELQGTYPVISISFANIKEDTYTKTKERIFQIITRLYSEFWFLQKEDLLDEKERAYYDSVNENMTETIASMAIHSFL